MIWPEPIQRRIKSNSAPYAREALRLGVILEKMAELVREAVLAGGLGGLDSILLDIIAEMAAWYDSRLPLREEQAQIAAAQFDAMLEGPIQGDSAGRGKT